MSGRIRVPMIALAAGLLVLIGVLATLQYRWLGQISLAERERMRATLGQNAAAFAEDFDRELNRAYLLFQFPPDPPGGAASQIAARYDWWRANARFPRLIKDVFVATPGRADVALTRYDPSTRFIVPAEWPAALAPVRVQLAGQAGAPPDGTLPRHAPVTAVWPSLPALVISAPVIYINRLAGEGGTLPPPRPNLPTYAVLWLDGDYIRNEVLPSLAQRHFQNAAGALDYEIAVVAANVAPTVPTNDGTAVYHSVAAFNPAPDAKADAAADLFHLRVQDFGSLAAEISRFTLFAAVRPSSAAVPASGGLTSRTQTVFRQTIGGDGAVALRDSGQVSIVLQKGERLGGAGAPVFDTFVAGGPLASAPRTPVAAPHWRLLVTHPAGSLEQAVNQVRRRNLLISTGILGVLGISVGFLIVSTRRAEELARRQLEFVATVSHELRTPLAVIRSAADNLADGVVGDDARVRQYGQLVRREGVRLTELVEQILEFAGLQSGQRGVTRHPVTIAAVLREAVAAAQSAADAAGVRIELSVADDLPSIAGDESALRRVFLNLIGNAMKYGAAAGWVGVRASAADDGLQVAVSDRGIGIAPAEQARIFDPFYRAADVVAAQIQGAGLGLSLVKRIVEAHGGRVGVRSAPGEGSTFTVTLPAGRQEGRTGRLEDEKNGRRDHRTRGTLDEDTGSSEAAPAH